MPDQTVSTTTAPGEPGAADRIGAPGAEPYTSAELAAVRDVIERYNRPDSPQRRLLATLDALTAGGAR
jgi:hypothetical protein